MNWFKQLFSRRHLYDDLSEEIQEHLEEKIEELVAGGMSRKEAAAASSPRIWQCNSHRRGQPNSLALAPH